MSESTLCSTETALPQFRDVMSPYDGRVVGAVSLTEATAGNAVIETARVGARKARALSRNARGKILDGAATEIEQRNEEFAQTIVSEAGKTIRQARKEVLRAVNTLRLSAAEARRNAGEVIPFDSYEGSEDRTGWYSREPLGIIAAITPFNDPLNLVAHKIGPAIAGGNAVILKPSALTPLSAQLLTDALVSSGLPPEALTIVHGDREVAEKIIRSRDVRMVSFTGGFSTGESIARTAGLKKLSMDLGGNAPVIVLDDAHIEKAVASCVSGAFWAAGQNCVGVQRILVAAPVYGAFRQRFLEATARLVAGDPSDEQTDVGPMISPTALQELQSKLDVALGAGAVLLSGNVTDGNVLQPTVLEASRRTAACGRRRFSALGQLREFNTFEEAIDVANAIEFSLHAGIFTDSLARAMDAARQLEAGGVMINDSSDYRFDGMPFGGAKYGSMGREGVHFAYEEMTQPKVICIKN